MYYKKLWQNFTGGDKKSLALLFRYFYEDLYNYGIKLTGSRDFTEDGLQDLFLKLWKTRDKLTEVENLRAYMFTSLRHVLIDSLRWYNRQTNTDKPEDEIFVMEFSPEDILIREQIDIESRKKILYALNSLPSRQKEAIYLRYFDNLDFETIASVMHINIQSARNFIHKGILALRELNFNKGI